MAVNYNPSVPTSNSVLYLDALNAKSCQYNLLTYSQDFTNASAWTVNGTITANTAIAPDGTLTASTLSSTSTNGYIWQAITPVANSNYTFSIYVKSVTVGTTLDLYIYYNSGASAFAGATFTTTGNWQRIVISGNVSTFTNVWATIGGAGTFTSGESIYIWGAQVNYGLSPAPYIRTTSSALTVWNDSSRNGNTGTMYGAVPYLTDGTGCLDFTGTTGANASSATLGFTFANNMIPLSGSFTLSCWVKSVMTTVGQSTLFSNAGGGDGYRFGIGTNGVYALSGPGYNEATIAWTSTFDNTAWNNVVAVYDRAGILTGSPNVYTYLNGVYQGALTLPTQFQSANAVPGLVRNACCQVWTGKLAVFSAYNSPFTADQTLQNYTALRGRFGV